MNQPIKLKKVVPLHVPEKTTCCGSDHDQQPGHQHAQEAVACCATAKGASQGVVQGKKAPPPEGASRVRYRIDKMDCPTEERLIRNRLEAMTGVVRLDFNLMARELTVYHRLDDPQPIASALNGLDMAPSLLETGAPVAALPPALSDRMKILLALSGVAAVGACTAAAGVGGAAAQHRQRAGQHQGGSAQRAGAWHGGRGVGGWRGVHGVSKSVVTYRPAFCRTPMAAYCAGNRAAN